jgi:hypothetical protein
MKKLIKSAILSISALVWFLGASYSDEVRGLSYEPVPDTFGNPGGGIKLMWDEPATGSGGFLSCSENSGPELDGYIVCVDGVDLPLTKETEYYVYTPAVEVAVYAVWDGQRSYPGTLDFAVVETPTVEVWSINDPSQEHPSGFGFSTAGTAAAYSVANNAENSDFYVSMGLSSNMPTLTSPSDHTPDPLNSRYGFSVEADESYYDYELVVSSAASTQSVLQNYATYGIIVASDTVYKTSDNFGKLLVTSLAEASGVYKATLKLGYQLMDGVAWVKD